MTLDTMAVILWNVAASFADDGNTAEAIHYGTLECTVVEMIKHGLESVGECGITALWITADKGATTGFHFKLDGSVEEAATG